MLQSHALTHIGLVRRRNEDAFLDRPEAGLWAVADGMGGHEAGDYASARVVAALAAATLAPDLDEAAGQVERQLTAVDGELRTRAASLGPAAVIATTAVVLLLRGCRFGCVWAGDSRLYRHRAGELQQMTTDHSQVQEMVDAGLLDRRDAAFHPAAHIVTQAIGGGRLAFGRVVGEVMPGDRFLLCSDGLTNMLSDSTIGRAVGAAPPREAAEGLLAATLARGARDNVTIVVVAA